MVAWHVAVDGDQLGRRDQGHLFGDERSPIAALRDVPVVSEALHQHDPRPRDARRIPAGFGRLAGKAVARHRRDHHVERIRCGSAVRSGIGERVDDLQQLDDRTGPAVRDDDRQRTLMLGFHMDEVDVEAVDLGDEVRQRLQTRLALAPIVLRSPVLDELLHRGQLHALCIARCRRGRPDPPRSCVGHQFALRPSRGVDAPAKLVNLLLREADREWADRIVFGGSRRRSRGKIEGARACRRSEQRGCRGGKKVAAVGL